MLNETIEAIANADSPHSEFEQYVRANRLFILGAGFSVGAGVPTTASLLRLTMEKFSTECPGIFARVENYTRELLRDCADNIDYEMVDFSELCTFLEYIELREYGGGERWSANGSREKLALRFYLAKTLTEHCPTINSIPDIYVSFAEQLQPGDIVISFNWDTLLETALIAAGKDYAYNSQPGDQIRLWKLHGSVNWRLGEPRNLRARPEMN